MDENELNGMEEDIIDFEDEEGNVSRFCFIDTVFYNGEEYAMFEKVSDEDGDEPEYMVCRVTAETDDNGEDIDVFERTEEELETKLLEIFETRYSGEEEEE